MVTVYFVNVIIVKKKFENLKNTHFSRKCCRPHDQNIKNAPGFLNRSDNSPSDCFYSTV